MQLPVLSTLNRCLPLLFLGSIITCLAQEDTLQICSPSNTLCIKVWKAEKLTYTIHQDGLPIVSPSFIDLIPEKFPSLAASKGIRSSETREVDRKIIAEVPEKRKHIPDRYTQLLIHFKTPYKVEFRAYDDGVAYRIGTSFKDSITIAGEIAEFHFPGQPSAYFPRVKKRDNVDIFHTSFEEEYPLVRLDSLADGTLGYSPILVVPAKGPKIGITESDLFDYPGMFLGGTATPGLKGVFAPYPAEEASTDELYSQRIVTKREPYIARTKGDRWLPWRVLIIAGEDRDLPANDLVYRLAEPSRIADPSWIRPGLLTDEWITGINLFNVPFKAGLNTASYKYYIDFAKRFGFKRIMMDAGWSDNNDLFKVNPDISMDTLVAYAREKDVKISMWTLAMTLEKQLEPALNQFKAWGVDFIMTDFMDRDDQKMVRFYERIAAACANHKIMIMFHGSYPPKGFNRTYPNAVGREGLLGSEYNIWSDRVTPGHDLVLPFTRMLAGGLDYEPGQLNNAGKTATRPVEGTVTSPGTRAHQLAMFVVYDSPMQLFSGNPSEALMEPEFMDLLGSLPTTWDETYIPAASIGEYIVTVRRKGDSWFVAGMSDWQERDLPVNFDFLKEGVYRATLCTDGVNADRYAADYTLEKGVIITKNDRRTVHLAPGGGFLFRLEKVK